MRVRSGRLNWVESPSEPEVYLNRAGLYKFREINLFLPSMQFQPESAAASSPTQPAAASLEQEDKAVGSPSSRSHPPPPFVRA